MALLEPPSAPEERPAPLVLIVEDEPKLARLVSDYLQSEGFETRIAFDGAAVMPMLSERLPDLILLDVMLPSVDGFELCRRIRSSHVVPIIMLTARSEESDCLHGLELGADDYITKPFSPREVVARVRALLRRSVLRSSQDLPTATWLAGTHGGLHLDEHNQQARQGTHCVNLTQVEFRLLKRIHDQAGKTLSRPQLMLGLYQDHRVVSERTVDSHLKNLRRKFTELGLDDPIEAVYGMGYRLRRSSAS